MTLFPTRSNKGRTAALLGGMGIGAALMYMLDPGRGARRRAVARDKAAKFARVAGERIGRTSRDLSNRALGVLAEARPSRSMTATCWCGAALRDSCTTRCGPSSPATMR